MGPIGRVEGLGLAYRLQLHVKPGAKASRVTDIGPEAIGIQVPARPLVRA